LSASEHRRPVVGLTTYLQQAQTGVWDVRAGLLPAAYLEGVGGAGGIAVLLPPQPVDPGLADELLDRIDGLIITGGPDLGPDAYGQPRHPATDEPGADNRRRDEFEFALVRAALHRGMPLLGICRGAQVLNVALGGTLHQHLPDVIGHSRHRIGNAVFATSTVRTVAGTRLAELIGPSAEVRCYHHQAIDRLGAGLIVSARDDEGVVEAIEGDPQRFPDGWMLGVQWHPEERLDDLRLFAAVVAAADAYAAARRGTVAATGGGTRP